MDDYRAQTIRDVAFAIAATIHRLTFEGSQENNLRHWMLSDSNMDRTVMEEVLSVAMRDATEESLQPLPLDFHPDRDPTYFVGWAHSRLHDVHRSVLPLSILLRSIRSGSAPFDPEELTERLRNTRRVFDEARFNVLSYPLAYSSRIEFVRTSLQAILVSADLMRPPPQWLRRHLRNRGYPGLPALRLVDSATIQEAECPICRLEYGQEPGTEAVHLPCDERHIFHARCRPVAEARC